MMMNPRTAAFALALAGSVVASVPGCRREEPAPVTAGARRYQCSMHPQIVSDRPGTCPICGMRLTLVEEAAPGAPARGDVPGRAGFVLSTERQQLIGVRRERVEVRDLDVELRAVGRIAYDPDLYQAIVEYREALAARRQLGASPVHEAVRGADAVVRAAALKLRQRGVTEENLASIAPAGRDPVNLLLPGKSVWVYAQVYEYEVELVRPGQQVTVTAPSAPGQVYSARVASIDPILDAQTRTARVRALVSTPDAGLRPESFVDVRIQVPLGRGLAVPRDAIMDTGEHQFVFVVSGAGEFTPRAVTLGREAGEAYEVLAGLEPGEEVVTSANFLIDSESRFRAALAGFGKAPAAGHVH
jgi:Cu(I)/Ag(I) efflux system membrane fusion protein